MMVQVITAPVLEIKGSAAADDGFKKWVLEYGQGADPGSWTLLKESNSPVEDGILYVWNLSSVPNGPVTLRLTLVGDKTEVDERVTLNISLAPTPTLSPFPDTPVPPTLPPTETPTPEIIIPTDTLAPTIETPTEFPTTTP